MKTVITASIDKVTKDGGEVTMALTGKGKSTRPNQVITHEASFYGALTLKALVANDIPLGALLTITITDEKRDE